MIIGKINKNEKKIKSTIEYLYGILGKTALNESDHLKTIETKRK